MEELEDEKPWDIKELCLSLGGETDEKGFITFQIFSDRSFNIYEGSNPRDKSAWHYEDIDLSAARRLRDFLIYAVPDNNIE